MFSSDGYKDSLAFIAETREFVCNLAVFDLIAAVVTTGISYPRGINEMTEAGLEAVPSRLVRPPRDPSPAQTRAARTKVQGAAYGGPPSIKGLSIALSGACPFRKTGSHFSGTCATGSRWSCP